MSSYIELPADKYANIGCRYLAFETGTRGYVVIEAYIDKGKCFNVLVVTAPAGFKWSRIYYDRARWAEVDYGPGLLSDAEYANLVLGVEGLPEWMYDAVRGLLED